MKKSAYRKEISRRDSLSIWICLPVLAIGVVLCCSGCGDRSGRLPIEGTVTLDGGPLDKGQISFRPQAGTASPSAGAGIVAGRFRIAQEQGLLPGKFRVEITASRPAGKMAPAPLTGELVAVEEQYLPAKYNLLSPLEAVVTAEGPNRLAFTLNSK